MNKDMSQYRENRKESKVVQTWLNEYKQSIMDSVIFRYYEDNPYSDEWTSIVNKNPECAEIVADTIIGWLNSPVGRSFIRESFDIKIPTGNDGINRNY